VQRELLLVGFGGCQAITSAKPRSAAQRSSAAPRTFSDCVGSPDLLHFIFLEPMLPNSCNAHNNVSEPGRATAAAQ
jgi:hypothetical protein